MEKLLGLVPEEKQGAVVIVDFIAEVVQRRISLVLDESECQRNEENRQQQAGGEN